MDTSTNSSACQCRGTLSSEPPAVNHTLGAVKTAKAVPSLLLSLFIAFFPKCPFCWAVYMSMLGGLGLARLPYMNWLLPVLLLLLVVHLGMLLKQSSRKGYLPFVLSLAGSLLILGGRNLLPMEKWLPLLGMVLVSAGSLANSFLSARLPRLSPLKK